MTTLENLRPTETQLVKRVVEAVGLPSNGINIYDWAFGKVGGPNVVFIWHSQLFDDNGQISFIDDSGKFGEDYSRQGKTIQSNQAYVMNYLITGSFIQKKSIRVAIVQGTEDKKGREHAEQRVLDYEFWYPHHIDPETRRVVVVRGVQQSAGYASGTAYANRLLDQLVAPPAVKPESPASSPESLHETTPEPEPEESVAPLLQTQTSQTTIYTRDPEVARQAKQRAANGECEFCGKRGFETAQGGYYLETRHAIPRSCDGPDKVWNVAAICADDHKRAHFGVDRHGVRNQLIKFLGNHYPSKVEKLLALANKMDMNLKSSVELETEIDT